MILSLPAPVIEPGPPIWVDSALTTIQCCPPECYTFTDKNASTKWAEWVEVTCIMWFYDMEVTWKCHRIECTLS